MRRLASMCMLCAAATLHGCGGNTAPGGNDNTSDPNANGNEPISRTETRDLSSFIVFSYDAGPLSCAEIGRVADATIVDLREQNLGIRVDLIILEQGDPDVDVCASAPPERGCLIERGPQTLFLSDDQIRTVLDAFAAIEVEIDDTDDCVESRCADLFDWDVATAFSSARCAAAPRLSPQTADDLADLLESLRSE